MSDWTPPPPSLDVTFRREDGELIGDEYGWTNTIDSLQDEVEYGDTPLAVLKETWERTAVERLWVFPILGTCDSDACDEEDADAWVLLDGQWHQRCADHHDDGEVHVP